MMALTIVTAEDFEALEARLRVLEGQFSQLVQELNKERTDKKSSVRPKKAALNETEEDLEDLEE